MAPRTINDDLVLFRIALGFLDEPNASFAAVERKATASVHAYRHSDDSRRKRLQRKFTADQARWMREAREYRIKERAERHAEQMRAFHDMMMEAGRAAAQALSNLRDHIGPRLAVAFEYLSRPEVQEGIRNISRAVEQMQRQQVITIRK